MNKLLIAAALCAVLAACNKEETAPATAPEATTAPDTTAAPEAAAADSAVADGLPQECEDYLARAQACFTKADPQLAAAFQQGIDQARGQWDSMADKSQLVAACTQGNEQFAQAVAVLQCE